MKERNKWILIGFCALMVFSALHSALRRHRIVPTATPADPAPVVRFAPRQRPIKGTNPARQFSDALADAVERVMPTVVVIRTEKVQNQLRRDYFGFIYIVPEQLVGEGSGVIIDDRGYIMTSYHVIRDAKHIDVVLNDGTKMQAREVGHDESTDLAVLEINGKHTVYPVVDVGDSDALRVGEMVVAIGSPFSLQSSVTMGIVSQKGRRMQVLPYEDFIQTDAAINEGNSGGPLIDVDGRLVGINAAILTDAQKEGVGIAFAVPSNLAMVIAKSLIEKGKHEWPWVGAKFGRMDQGASLQVLQVWRDTPAARAGMQPGDIILQVNGKEMKDAYDIYRVIFNHSVGEKVDFLIQRDKKKLEFVLPLEEFPGMP